MADRAVGIPFAKEGIPFIGAAAGVTLLAGWLGWTIAAVGAAIVLHAFTVGPSLLLGVIFAAQAGLNVRGMQHLADQAEARRSA